MPKALGTHVDHLVAQADAYAAKDYARANAALPRGLPARLRGSAARWPPRLLPPDQAAGLGAPAWRLRSELTRLLGEHVGPGARHAAGRRDQRPRLPGDGGRAQRQHDRRHRRGRQPLRRAGRVAVHVAVGRPPRPARHLRRRRRGRQAGPPPGASRTTCTTGSSGSPRSSTPRPQQPGARARPRRGPAGPRRPAAAAGRRVRRPRLPAGPAAGQPDLPAGVRARPEHGRRLRGDARGPDAAGRRARPARGGMAADLVAAGRGAPAGRPHPAGRRTRALPLGADLPGGRAAGPAADPRGADRHAAAAARPGRGPDGRGAHATSGSPAGSPTARGPARTGRR